VIHIGKAAERQMWSSGVSHAQFMRDVPSRGNYAFDVIVRPRLRLAQNGSANEALLRTQRKLQRTQTISRTPLAHYRPDCVPVRK